MKDSLAIAVALLLIAAVIAWPIMYILGPCDWLAWLPIAEAPTRCVL